LTVLAVRGVAGEPATKQTRRIHPIWHAGTSAVRWVMIVVVMHSAEEY
jgi:hypothetical protein